METKVTAVESNDSGIEVTFETKDGNSNKKEYDAVLVAIGRSPNGKSIDAEKAGIEVTHIPKI